MASNNIPLTSMTSTIPTPAAPLTTTQPLIAPNQLAGNTNNANAITTPSTTLNSNSAVVAISSSTANQQPNARLPWRKVRHVPVLLAKLLFAIACAIVTYLAFDLAMWSAAKDYRDDCRSQDVGISMLTSTIPN